MIMTGVHDGPLVTLSILIAMFASFTALSLANRMRASSGRIRRLWLFAAATALGAGIWSMHFIAMLAFSMPGMDIGYDLTLTLVSLGFALLFTGAGFAVINWQIVQTSRLAVAGLLIGTGVLAMHYSGMAAMRMAAAARYDWLWLAASAFIAIGAATSAVYLAARDQKTVARLAASGVMGIAIAGMHYAGMRAVTFVPTAVIDASMSGASLDRTFLAGLIGMVTCLILLMGLGAAALERIFQRFVRREARTALRLRISDALRADSSTRGLQVVASLLGNHFGVSRTGYGQLDPVEDMFDYDVCWTDGSAPPLLGRLPAAAFGAKIVAALKNGQTVVIDDLQTSDMSDEAETRATARSVDTRAILVVPFLRDGRLRTIVYLNDRRPRAWRRDDIGFIEEIAERTRLVVERAAAEEELRALNATLEQRVAERTRELHEAQAALLHAQKLEAVGQLVSGMAHDFNNVLGAIGGAFDLIRRRRTEADRVETYAQSGLEATKRGAKLTAQLLTFARSQQIQLRPLLVGDVIWPLHEMLSRTLGPMIRLEFELTADPAPVLADETQIEMMIVNLAINARDAMPEGGVLNISTKIRAIANDPELADGEYVEISVRDNGVGMDETTLRRAIEPFFTTKPVGKGTGLGLAQIYGSTRQAGGSLRLESTIGGGTIVRVLLPRTTSLPSPVLSASFEGDSPRSTPLHVLLVDDDQHVRFVVSNMLKELGHQVTEADGGASALSILQDQAFDIAIVDYAMPGMNGAELAAHISRQWSRLPILFASGFANTDAIQQAVGRQVTLLRKPFEADELRAAMTQVLNFAPTPLNQHLS